MSSRAEDEAACTALCTAFAHHIDARRYEPLLHLFTEDGVLDRMGTVCRGHGEISRFLDARPTDVQTRHLCTSIRVDFDGKDQATGSCYVLFFQGRGDGVPVAAGPPSVVEYHDRFERTPGGWRIRERSIRMAMRPTT
jgi:hypothetical protein